MDNAAPDIFDALRDAEPTPFVEPSVADAPRTLADLFADEAWARE